MNGSVFVSLTTVIGIIEKHLSIHAG